MGNLNRAFPEKTDIEKKKIARKFYRNFIDTFIETIKVLSMSDADFDKRCTHNFEVINGAVEKGKNIQLLGAHMFNWEYGNLVTSKNIKVPSIGIYGTIENKAIDKIFYKIRSRYNTILVSTKSFKREITGLMRKQHVMCLLADQTPGNPQNAYWLNFFNSPAPFINGPGKNAGKNNNAIIFMNFERKKRGHYFFNCIKVIEEPTHFTPKELTLMYRDFVEGIVRQQPDNYLWSHRRWKWNYTEEFYHLWIDKN